MGFNTVSLSTTLKAKLTPLGRQLFMANNSNLVTTFSLGDSDANYYVALPLVSGEVPANSGEVGPNGSISNSVGNNIKLRSALVLDASGTLKKAVEPHSAIITTDILNNGLVTTTGTSISNSLISRADSNSNSLVNLYYSFGLPLTTTEDAVYTGMTIPNGYSGTTFSGLSAQKILVLGIDNNIFGETLDGKAVKVSLPTSAATYTIYSTFMNKGLSTVVEDANYTETSPTSEFIGNNIAFLFSDNIAKPNNDSSLSWATGFGTFKPFTVHGKQFFNYQTDSNVNEVADTMVGVAYLDKGFVVITHPTIVNNYTASASTAITITFDSISTSVSQNITCIADRGEFGVSNNRTFAAGNTPRISEVGLYDAAGNLIAVAKTDRQILKSINQFMALGVKISS